MNMYDKAYELARALRESSELKEIKEINELIKGDADSKRMLDDFRQRQTELQQKMMSGEMPSQEEMQKMEKLYEVINLNPSLRRLFDAERRLGVIMEDVQRIISEPLQDVMKS
ncbi:MULTISPECIES: YlbF family regulator [Paenibacillus]|uniref:UPF0342 protein NV381_25855 n=1 Tax=Paenibacillus radicis (ex Xue et al. 2023) TaxID=2972489 RepID=A0ABT1YN70_9BACL|nr:YlbF family regulator [Paenibacillus radicis (ex Xue et al. 2023)]MCR8634627.1 YlbF family regulator [Paenibacillus radicis (ex Xue et al. 2023)]